MSDDREAERPTGGQNGAERPASASGAAEKRCTEAQADGVPCDNVATVCEECERAQAPAQLGGRGGA